MSSKISVKEFIKEYENVDLFIPLLQRNYKWPDNAKKDNNSDYSEKESGKRNTAHNLIWEIIDNYEKNKKNETTMTLGIVVLYKEEDTTKQLILDGQQRLITLTLIVRCLINLLNREWFTYKFERDFDLNCRYGYMFELEKKEQEEKKSVDLDRMRRNYEEIENVIKKKNFTEYEGLLSYIKTNIFFIVRSTTTPPLDEFFNINSHKTPFSISDYIKVFLLNDISTIENNEEKLEKKNKILGLYRDISYYLYYKEEDSDNSIYEMVSREYDNIRESLSVNRMDLIFEDKYNPDRKKTAEVNREDISSIYNLDSEMERIEYFFYVLKGIKEELYTRDSENNVHKNSNVFNSFYVLNTYVKKRFFSLFSEDDIKSKKDPNGVIRNFCLQEFCAKETRKLENINASNAFIDSVMHYEINDSIESRITVNNEGKFKEVEKLFFELYDEYTEIIKKGKELNNKQIKEEEIKYTEQNGNKDTSENQEQNQYTIKDLFKKVNKIIIPEIQRDYIKGCDIEEFLNDILNKITKCLLKNIEFNCGDIEETTKYLGNLVFRTGYEDVIKEDELNLVRREFWENYFFKKLVSGEFEDDLSQSLPKLKDFMDMRNNCNRCYLPLTNKLKKNVENIKQSLLENKAKYTYIASCIVGYCDNENNLFIYDGQQRLASFVGAIGWLKRKVKDVPKEVNDLYKKEVNDLYKKFEFSGRNKANEAIEMIYESNDDDDELLKKLRSLICDQTTDAIYKLVCKLKEKCDNDVYIPYNYFYDMMSIEYYGIEKSDETTQLFMDINDGCRLEEYEIYKAEFMHYLEKEKGSCERVKEIQKKLDNSFIDLFFGLNNPEEEEVKALKELIKITYIERFHDYKYKDFPKALIDIVDKFADNEFIEKLDSYMSKFEEYYMNGVKENSKNSYYYDYNNISTFCSIKQYEDCNELQYKDIFNNYHFEDSDDGSVLLYCNFEKLIEYIKKELKNVNLDLKLKIRYDLHKNGYIKLEDFKCKYNLDCGEEDFNNLLKKMTNKDFRDDDEGEKVEYKPEELCNTEIQLTSDDCKDNNLLLKVLSNKDNFKDNLKKLFFGENVTLKLDREKIIDILNSKICEYKEEQKKIIYETFANNYEVVVLGDEVYIYDHDEEKYKKTENENVIVLKIKLTLEDIKKKYCKKEFFKISEFRTLDKKKALCILLLLKYNKVKIDDDNFGKYYVYDEELEGHWQYYKGVKFLNKEENWYASIEEKVYYYDKDDNLNEKR